ncbi:hypothetical protein IJD44_07890 [bacterium]|nr:hypothetical protein [bacterium]
MKYITIKDYMRISNTQEVENETDIEVLIELASMSVNKATLTRIEKRGFDNLTPNQQELIKKAVVEQMNYISEEYSELSNVSSYSLNGDISINFKDNNEIYDNLELTKKAYLYLQQTGLMFRGC